MTRAAAFFFLLVIFTAALPAGAAPRAQAAPAVAPGVSNPDFMGMVIRDPWYDFGTNPAFQTSPTKPSRTRWARHWPRWACAGCGWIFTSWFRWPM